MINLYAATNDFHFLNYHLQLLNILALTVLTTECITSQNGQIYFKNVTFASRFGKVCPIVLGRYALGFMICNLWIKCLTNNFFYPRRYAKYKLNSQKHPTLCSYSFTTGVGNIQIELPKNKK